MAYRTNLSRRQLIQGSTLSILSGSMTGCAKSPHQWLESLWLTTSALEVVRVSLRIPRPLTALHGYKIGFLTDIHHGMWLDPELLSNCVAALEAESLDLLILGGDYVYGPPREKQRLNRVVRNRAFDLAMPASRAVRLIAYDVAARLRVLASQSRDGTIAVLGNHDRWHHPSAVLEAFHEDPFTLLVNSSVVVKREDALLSIIGVDDFLTGRPALPAAAKRAPLENEIRILVSHNPDYIPVAHLETEHQFHLALCGHTHGGQVKLPFLGALIYNVENRQLAESWSYWAAADGRRTPVYTSRGVGVVEVPYRIACPPEVTVITLAAV